MERFLISQLEKWNNDTRKKPLIMMGARQVGKTWLIHEFARRFYPNDTVEVNLMADARLREQFAHIDLDTRTVTEVIAIAKGRAIVPGKTLLIIDEIQEAPRALTSLKFFNEEMPELAVIAAGSLLGLSFSRKSNATNNSASFPVGKVDFLEVPPMTFGEFLLAVGERPKWELCVRRDWAKLDLFHTDLVDWVRKYCFVGGMPEAVATYAAGRDLAAVRKVQQQILTAYDEDFAKHADKNLLPKIRLLWNNIPAQLAKENKKFIYTALRSGARARDYEATLQWLADAGMITRVHNVSTPLMPLKAYADFGAFKLYMHDVGLLAAMSNLPPQILLDGNEMFIHFKGALAEQYVLQELLAMGIKPYYWSPDNIQAEIEYLLQGNTAIYPLEVKAAVNLRAKSLLSYRERFQPPQCLRTSMSKHTPGEKVHDIPLYALNTVVDELS